MPSWHGNHCHSATHSRTSPLQTPWRAASAPRSLHRQQLVVVAGGILWMTTFFGQWQDIYCNGHSDRLGNAPPTLWLWWSWAVCGAVGGVDACRRRWLGTPQAQALWLLWICAAAGIAWQLAYCDAGRQHQGCAKLC